MTKGFQKGKFEGIFSPPPPFPTLPRSGISPWTAEGWEALPHRAPASSPPCAAKSHRSPLDIPRVPQAARAPPRGEIPTPLYSRTPRPRGFQAAAAPAPLRGVPCPSALIGSIRTRRANIPNYLPESAATSPPLRPPGPDRLSAPAARPGSHPAFPKSPSRRRDPNEGSPLPAPPPALRN